MRVRLHRPGWWLTGAAVLLVTVALALILWPRIARKALLDELESRGAVVSYLETGPAWLRRPFGSRAAVLDDLWSLSFRRADIDRLALERTISHLRDCEYVAHLDLSWTPLVNADLECLRGMPRLEELDLSGTDIGDEGLSWIDSCPHLRTLILSNTAVSDAGLERLRSLQKLEVLILDGTQVTNAGMTALSQVPRLRNVSLSNTGVTDQGVNQLAGHLPDLAISDD